MTLTQDIDDLYILYLLLGKDIHQLNQYSNKSKATLQKYITIKERLDFSLFDKLDKKGNQKLTLDIALFICKRVLNPNIHPLIYPEIQFLKTKEQKNKITSELNVCVICAEESICMEQMPCCSQHYTCETCIMNIIQNSFENITYDLPKCPFCNLYLKPSFILQFIKNRRRQLEPWIDTFDYRKYSTLPSMNNINARNRSEFMLNCQRIVEYLLEEIEEYYERNVIDIKHNRLIELGSGVLCDKEHEDPLLQSEINNLKQEIEYICGPKNKTVLIIDSNVQRIMPMIQKDRIFGTCYSCKNKIGKEKWNKKLYRQTRIRRSEIRRHYTLCSIERQCANQENELFEVKEEMFQCEDCSDGTIKQCPHCGITTLKPDGCNYVICGDHRWCWICEERLEVSHEGHNEHYWTGPGTSPYSNQCRQSMKLNNKPRFILNVCNCSSCINHQGLPICKTLDCMNRTFYINHATEVNKFGGWKNKRMPNAYCRTCQTSILDEGKHIQASMSNFYTELNSFEQEEPDIAKIYYM